MKDFVISNLSSLDIFLFLYNNFCALEHYNERIAKLNDAVSESLYNLYSAYQEKGNLELKTDLTCPKCGLSKENKFRSNRFVVLKCGRTGCGLHCTFDTEPWNNTVFQRIADIKKKHEEVAIDKRVESYLKMLKQGSDEQIRKIRSQATEKIDEIKRNERKRAKEEFLSHIPFYLRWIMAKYFK